MGRWTVSPSGGLGGRFVVVVTPSGGNPVDVTMLRGSPVKIPSYSSADPFGDAAAALSFPQISILDDLDSPELAWLRIDANVDIWWVAGYTPPSDWAPAESNVDSIVINTESGPAIAPFFSWGKSGGTPPYTITDPHQTRGVKVFEGILSSIDAETDGGLSVQCQGALLQADLYKAKPFYPPRPITVESLILAQFDKTQRPNLRTQPAVIEWPSDWTLTAPAFTGSSTVFDPNVRPGAKWTGYTTRQTGSWDASLTSFIQNLLATMLIKPGSGVPTNAQWTLQQARAGDPAHPAGRTPVLQLRRRDDTPAFSVWAGVPGVDVSLTQDGTQRENSIYGTGTDVGGTTWTNSVVASDGSRTDYLPLAASRDVYPITDNTLFNRGKLVRESYIQFGTGFAQTDATDSAEQMLARDADPGWSGTVTLSVDPSPTFSRWQIFAGMSFTLCGFLGTGSQGMKFHIASAGANPEDGTVALTVDTRYRDLLTLNEAIARTRDPLTPAKLLQLNRNTVTIEDIQAPWNYTKGSGFVPRASTALYAHKPTSTLYPYTSWIKAHPPRVYPGWYVTCRASAAATKDRWAGPIPILMAEKGTIRRSEFFCVDRDGNLIADRFHVSLYYNNGINYSFMPHSGSNYNAFLSGAFETIDPSTGEPWAKPGLAPDNSMVIGWGNSSQPAGYSPGLYTNGTKPTGMLVDEGTWTWDCSANNPNYDHLAKAGKEASSVISVYAMFYMDWSTTVYFGGRLYRQEPGTSS